MHLHLALLAGLLASPVASAPVGSVQAIASASASDWRPVDQADLMYIDLPAGRVVIELAPLFAPAHVTNIRTLVRERFFDGTAIVRVQDNYVAQWGDPSGKRRLGTAKATLPLEAERASGDIAFTPLPYRDSYAPETGFAGNFPAARDPKSGRLWLTHCYGVVGVGRDAAPDSGSGAELFAVIGHAPRHLDRNYAPVGRVVEGIERLSSLPRGSGTLGFYEKEAQRTPLLRVRMGTDVPESERLKLEVLHTGSDAFAAYVAARANRERDGFLVGASGVDVCNIRVPQRTVR